MQNGRKVQNSPTILFLSQLLYNVNLMTLSERAAFLKLLDKFKEGLRKFYGDQFTFDAADRRVVFNDIYGLCDRKSRAFEGGRQQGYIKDRFVSDHSLCYHQCVPGGLYQ